MHLSAVFGFALLALSVAGDNSDGLDKDARNLFRNHLAQSNCLHLADFNKIFLDMDTWPQDQQISEKEFADGWHADHLNDADFTPFFFAEVDHNHNNEIEVSELNHLFGMFDMNANGCIESSEYEYTWAALFSFGDD